MISNNIIKHNNHIHASVTTHDFCRWKLQTHIRTNQLSKHHLFENYTQVKVEAEYAALKFMQTECFYVDELKNGHKAILRYLHSCLNPMNPYFCSVVSIEEIGMKLSGHGHKNLTERPTRLLLKQLEIKGFIYRTKLNRRSSYQTYLTTRGYVYIVDNHLKPVQKRKKRTKKCS
jgi:hypothetical protein